MKVEVILDGPDQLIKQLVGMIQLEVAGMDFEVYPEMQVAVLGESREVKVIVKVIA